MNNNIMAAILISILLVVGTAAAFYYTVWEDVEKKKVELETEIEGLRSDVEKLKSLDKEIATFKKRIAEAEEKKNKLQTESIRLEDVVPRLLDSTETVSNKFDIKFQDIRISPLVRAEDWSELPVEMTILGTFKNITCFLNVMENRKLINLAAGSMNVSVSSEVDKDSGSPLLSVTLSAKVYIL